MDPVSHTEGDTFSETSLSSETSSASSETARHHGRTWTFVNASGANFTAGTVGGACCFQGGCFWLYTCFTIAAIFAIMTFVAASCEEYSLAVVLGLPAILLMGAGTGCFLCHSVNGMNCCLLSGWVNALFCTYYGLCGSDSESSEAFNI